MMVPTTAEKKRVFEPVRVYLPAAARRSTRCPQDWQSVDDDMRAMGFRFINRGWYWAGLQYQVCYCTTVITVIYDPDPGKT